VRRHADLPAEAQRYIARLEEISGAPAAIVSTGTERGAAVVRDTSFATAFA
jgi:adenylosuccinate synthase